MASASWIRYAYLARLSRPKSARLLYRAVKRDQVARIVEVGIGDVMRSVALIEVAQRFAGKSVAYTGIDWFDERPAGQQPLTLKDAYQLLRATGAQVRLVPGQPGTSLALAANAHQGTDFISISQAVADADLAAAWFYVPRMLHECSLLFRENAGENGESVFVQLSHAEVAVLAARGAKRRAA